MLCIPKHNIIFYRYLLYINSNLHTVNVLNVFACVYTDTYTHIYMCIYDGDLEP